MDGFMERKIVRIAIKSARYGEGVEEYLTRPGRDFLLPLRLILNSAWHAHGQHFVFAQSFALCYTLHTLFTGPNTYS